MFLGNSKRFFEVLPIPMTKLILLHAAVCLHYTYHIKWRACLVKRGGGAVKGLKTNYYNSILVTIFTKM